MVPIQNAEGLLLAFTRILKSFEIELLRLHLTSIKATEPGYVCLQKILQGASFSGQ